MSQSQIRKLDVVFQQKAISQITCRFLTASQYFANLAPIACSDCIHHYQAARSFKKSSFPIVHRFILCGVI